MAEMITLRAYLNELESMLENESPTEVLSHCRYILQHYPQNVATYRLLGKALLRKGHTEGLREHFEQAADIFQRVLSVIPDDLVAHLALSEIREQEGALDAAIWHMERARDQMPGNAMLRDALRKLYTRKSGLESTGTGKLQLSRGALARQYADSQLYDQAILELRDALQASPSRVDLQVLLATLLWDTQRTLEAGELALEILKQLPNCLQANALMARFWLAHSRPADAQPFLNRVEAVDPYAAVGILRPGQDVPDSNVLTRLDYTARAAAALSQETPEWVQELSDLGEERSAFISFAGQAGAGPAQPPDRVDLAAVFADEPEPAQPPEWVREMLEADRDAGPEWMQGSHAAAEQAADIPTQDTWEGGTAAPDEEEADLTDEPLPEDEIPAWFASVPETEPQAEDETVPDWFAQAPAEDQAADRPSEAETPGAMTEFLAAIEQARETPYEPEVEEEPAGALDWLGELEELETSEPVSEMSAAGATAPEHESWAPEDAVAELGAASAQPEPADEFTWEAEEAEADLTPRDWLEFAAPTPETAPWAADAAPEDGIADIDSLLRALDATEASGQPDESASGWPAEDHVETAASVPDVVSEAAGAPQPDDWLAMFATGDEEEFEQAPDAAEPGELVKMGQPAEEEPSPEDWSSASFEWMDSLPDVETPAGAQGMPGLDFAAQDEESVDGWRDEGVQAEAEAALVDERPQEEAEVELPESTPPAEVDVITAGSDTQGVAKDDQLRAETLAWDAGDVWAEEPEETEPAAAETPGFALPDAEAALPEDDLMAIFGAPVDVPAFDFDAELAARELDEAAEWSALVDEPDQSVAALEEPPAQGMGDAAEPPLYAGAGPDEVGALAWDAVPEEEEIGQPEVPFAVDESPTGESAGQAGEDVPATSGLARAVEEAQQSQSPDWMADLGVPPAPDNVVGDLFDEAYDPFEGGDPAGVPKYESAGHTGVLQPDEEPDWMRAFSGEPALDEADESEAVEPLDFAAVDLVDEAPEDVLAPFDISPQAAEAPAAETRPPAPEFDVVDWDMPGDELILGAEPEPRADQEAEMPDWLSAITQAAADDVADLGLDDQELFAPPEAASEPEWLREADAFAEDEGWAATPEAPSTDQLARAIDLPDTRSASPAEPVEEDEFDPTFSFADRQPTWLRRGEGQTGREQSKDPSEGHPPRPWLDDPFDDN